VSRNPKIVAAIAVAAVATVGTVACGGQNTSSSPSSVEAPPEESTNGAACLRNVEHVQDFAFEDDPLSPGASVLVIHTDLAPDAYDDSGYIAGMGQECFGPYTAVEVDDANGTDMSGY